MMYKVRGFTMIELMITLAVVGIIVALALPSFRDLIERKHLGGAVEAVFEQLEFARSQAVKRSKPVLVDFNVNGTGWSIGVTDKMAGCDAEDNSGTDACTIDYDNDAGTTDPIVMRIHGDDYKNITMSQATAFADPPVPTPGCITTSGEQGCFDYVQGFARTGAYNFTSANSTYTLQVQIDQLGRTSLCVPENEEAEEYKDIAGYGRCE